jgi:putative endonuclease
MWLVYILRCKNGDLYTGVTNNLQRRFEEHVSGRGGYFTKSFAVEKILFSEEYLDKISAFKREVQIKGWTRKKKLALIQGDSVLLKNL